MDPALRPFFERLRDLYADEAAFEARAREVEAEFAGLLDAEAVGLYLLDLHGRNEGAVVSLADARGRPEATVVVTVESIGAVKEFQREGGTGRVVNVAVADATDKASLTLWDRDVEKAEDGTLAPGSRVKVVNARVKDSRFGLELHVTPWTALEVEGAPDPAKRKLLTDTLPDAEPPTATTADPQAKPPPAAAGRAPHEPLASARAGDALHLVRARLLRLDPTRPFQRADGTTGFVATALVEDASGRATLTLWDEAVRAARALPAGAELEATDLVAKERNGRLELHTTRATRITAYQEG